jgi:hypothetical protein
VRSRDGDDAIVLLPVLSQPLRRTVTGRPDTDDLVREVGTNANRLVATDAVYDRYTGQPRMSNVPVKITKRGDAT